MADYNDNVPEQGSDSANGSESELEVWREVHSSILIAIRKAQSAIAQNKAQGRFLLEEIAGNLNADGTLKGESIWKRPVPLFRHQAKVTSASKGGGTGKTKTGKILLKKRKKSVDLSAEKPAKKPRKKKSDAASEPKVTKKKKQPSPKILKKHQMHKKSTSAISDRKQPPPTVEASILAASSDDDDAGKHDEKMVQEGQRSNNNSDDEGINDGEDRDVDQDDDYESSVEGEAGLETNEREHSYATSSWAEMQYQQHSALLVPHQQHQHHHQHHPLHHPTQQQLHPSSRGLVPPLTQTQSAAQRLQLMAAVAFGAVGHPPPEHYPQADHHPAFHPHNQHHHPSTTSHHLPTSHHLAAAAASQGLGWPNLQPQPPHYLNQHNTHLQQQPQAAYVASQAPRNYASLNDIASDEEEEDRF